MEHEKVLERLEEVVYDELEKLAKKAELNPAEIKAATDAACFLEKIKMLRDEGYDDDASESYSHGGSYRRGRSPRTGRYVSMSMNDGVSRHSINDRIVDKLERMMDESGSEYERSVISGWIDKIGSN